MTIKPAKEAKNIIKFWDNRANDARIWQIVF